MSFEKITLSAKPFAPFFDRACAEFGIIEPMDRAHLAAQCAHESNGFKTLVENLNYSAKALLDTWPKRFTKDEAEQFARQPERIANRVYANRMGNGPESSGDGWKFRGHGLIQTTGAKNIGAVSRALFVDDRLLKNPELLTDPETACRAAAFYWRENGLSKWAIADNIEAVSGIVNTGSPLGKAHGLIYRQSWLRMTKKAYDLKP